jgi:hypothetical protein
MVVSEESKQKMILKLKEKMKGIDNPFYDWFSQSKTHFF